MLLLGVLYAVLYVVSVFTQPKYVEVSRYANDLQNILWGIFVGELVIQFGSIDELNGLIDRLAPGGNR